MYKYKYNGKELQDELGLNMTAMDYRQYDSAIGRFNCIDALSETSTSATPYHFGYNNPVFWSDPSGLLSQGAIQAMWDGTANGGRSTWTNNGAGFSRGNLHIDYEGYETIEPIGVSGTFYKSSGRFTYDSDNLIGGSKYGLAEKVRDHVYARGSGYQTRRDKISSRQWDKFQDFLGSIGTGDPSGLADGLNSIIYGFRGQWRNAGISAIAIFPYAGDIVKGGKYADKTYDVYHGLDESGAIKYVGITSRNPAVRFSEHAGSIGSGKEFLDFSVISSGLTKQQARVMEQTIINLHGLAKDGGALLNKINSIAPINWAKNGINK